MRTNHLLHLLTVLACLGGAAACRDDTIIDTVPVEDGAPPSTALAARPATGAATSTIAGACGTGSTDLERCEVVAVSFAQPLLLDDVQANAAERSGGVVALWRSQPACVDAVSGAGPTAEPATDGSTTSSFAYTEGDRIGARRQLGPPPTNGGWSQSLWVRFAQEWTSINPATTTFTGAALLVPIESDTPGDTPVTARVPAGPPDSRVIYLDGHDLGLAQALGVALDRTPC